MPAASSPSAPPSRAVTLRLAGYSFLILFVELALIRYVAAYVRVFGFFVNFVLIAAFLGMGVGLLRTDAARRLRWIGPPALLALLALVKLFSGFAVRQMTNTTEALWAIAPNLPREIGIVPAVLVLFTACAVLFIPFGACLGQEFRRLPALTAYSVDVTGSLIGVLAFGAMSAFGTPPLAWFGLALCVWLALALADPAGGRGFAAVGVPCAAGALLLVGWTAAPQGERWSPYYRITTDRVFMTQNPHPTSADARGIAVNVNGALHQYMVDFSVPSAVRTAYRRPYAYVPHIDTALVVGAGTGNDVAILLQLGARYIDAVEIDPVIYALGRAEHFQQPYSDPRVHVHIDDARAFLRRSGRRYDVITMGTLDSQTLLSGMSSVRLDNYVYTLEALEAARDHLAPDGSLVAYHMSPAPYIAAKVFQLTVEAFHQLPRAWYHHEGLFNLTVVAGAAARGTTLDSVPRDLLLQDVTLPTDDWPYLYLREPAIPVHYVIALAGVLIVAITMVGIALRGLPRPGADRRAPSESAARRPIDAGDAAMFCMGVGFLLLEAKSVTEMSLLFGSTWTVNLLVFAAILIVIAVANGVASSITRRALPRVFGALFAALAVAFVTPVRSLLPLGTVGQWAAGAALVALPVFFAALGFAVLLRDRRDTTRALAYNVLGAIVGGVLEYAAMATGVKALYLIAAIGYLGALVCARRAIRLATPAIAELDVAPASA